MNSVTISRMSFAVFGRRTTPETCGEFHIEKTSCSYCRSPGTIQRRMFLRFGRMSSMGLAPFCEQQDVVKIKVPERKTCRKQPAAVRVNRYSNSCINIGYIASYLVSLGLGRYLPCLSVRRTLTCGTSTSTFTVSPVLFWLPIPFT